MIGQRLQQIMNHYQLSPVSFSEKLHIQRSSLSHFFSGRNKPGWEFLEKLARAFPEVNIHWFITGIGNMLIEKSVYDTDVNLVTNVITDVNTVKSESEVKYGTIKEQGLPAFKEMERKRKEISQVIVLYSDNTCKVYHSE
jgi:transcriptional regulator with XRE-family HTH domain